MSSTTTHGLSKDRWFVLVADVMFGDRKLIAVSYVLSSGNESSVINEFVRRCDNEFPTNTRIEPTCSIFENAPDEEARAMYRFRTYCRQYRALVIGLKHYFFILRVRLPFQEDSIWGIQLSAPDIELATEYFSSMLKEYVPCARMAVIAPEDFNVTVESFSNPKFLVRRAVRFDREYPKGTFLALPTRIQ